MRNKIRNIFTKENVICSIFIILCFLLFLFDLMQGQHSGKEYLIFSCIALFVVVVIIFLVSLFKKQTYNIYYKFYAIVAIIVGIIFILISPPFMGSDEKTHFSRVYEISEGHLITRPQGDVGILATMPRSINKAYTGYADENKPLKGSVLYSDIPSRLNIPLNKEDLLSYCSCNQTNYFGASLYSPIQYLPHLIGVEIGKILNLGPTWILYLARLCNLLAFVILTTIGIKLLPKFKLTAMLILLSPVVMSGATTVSADGITNACIFLFISYIVNIIHEKIKIQIKEKMILGLLTFFIAMCKIVYFPIIFLAFLIPQKQFKNIKDNYIFKILLIFFGAIFSFGWFYIANLFLDSNSATYLSQKNFVFTHPIEFMFMIIRTYVNYIDLDIMNIFFGNQLYHWSLKVYPLFSILYVFVIALSLFTEKAKFNLTKWGKVLIGLIIMIITILISTALFVQNGVGTNGGLIGGIQARYFIPLLFLGLLFINIKKKRFSENTIFVIFVLLYLPAVLTIILRFI